jgi:uncharacterized RDD family membrane protein YckC
VIALNIPTFLNIDLKLELASSGRRIGAYFIDWAIKIAYLTVISLSTGANYFSDINPTLVQYILFAPFVFYSFLMEWLFKGQTIGKIWTKIKVIGAEGNIPSVSQCAIRWMFLLVDGYLFLLFTLVDPVFAVLLVFSPLVGLIVMSTNKYHQRIGDIAANTYLVNSKEQAYSIFDTIYAYSSQYKDEYTPKFPEIMRLNDKDMTILKKVLEESESTYDEALAEKLAKHIKKILDIEADEENYVFLKQLLKDYNYLSLKN